MLLVLTRSKGDYRIEWRAVRLEKNMLGSICALGLPSAVQLAVTAFSIFFVQSYINRFGADCMAGWTSYNKIDSFALLPITTISLAVTTFVRQNLGAGDHARAKKGTRTALLLSEAVTVVVLLPLMLLSPQLISLFNQEPEVLRYGTLFIRFISPFYLVICINQIISGSLRGAGDSRSCMLIMLGSFVLFRQIYLMIVYRVWGDGPPGGDGLSGGLGAVQRDPAAVLPEWRMEKGKRLQEKSRIKHKRPAGTLRQAVLSSTGAKGLRVDPAAAEKSSPLRGRFPLSGEMSRRDKGVGSCQPQADGEVAANLLQPLRLGVPPSHLPFQGRLLGVRTQKRRPRLRPPFVKDVFNKREMNYLEMS